MKGLKEVGSGGFLPGLETSYFGLLFERLIKFIDILHHLGIRGVSVRVILVGKLSVNVPG